MLTNNETLIRLGLIILLSGIIGLDRELKHKPAGMKTHILVGLGSTIFMLVSIYMYEFFKAQGAQVDPGRIAAQVVTGIGFLGAGTIILTGGAVVGLTTAASLWAVAGIGLAAGSGMYFLAIVSTIAISIVFLIINRFTDMVGRQISKARDHIRTIRGKKK
jgi:putative Mg2+ transporter-C (MgtC) family protein